jgi:hypothetical protein
VKCGCTVDLERRLKQQNYVLPNDVSLSGEIVPGDPRVDILAILTDVTNQRAGDLERYWNKFFGYPSGPHYAKANWNNKLRMDMRVRI